MQPGITLLLFNDRPAGASSAHFERFRKENVLERLHSIDAQARSKGLASLDPAKDPLIGLGMELDASNRVRKNSYGVFNLSWQAESHPEWVQQVQDEVAEIRRGIQQTHGSKLRHLIWAGMGGSVEDKCMYQAVSLLRRGPRYYALDSTDPAKLKWILEDMQNRSKLPLPAALRSTLVVGMSMGMTSYEPVMNLEKLSLLYKKHEIDAQPNFIYMTLPGSLLDRFAKTHGYRKVELQLDSDNTTAGRHSAPLTRGSLYPLALARVDLKSWIEGAFLSEEEIDAAWKLSSFIHAQGQAGRSMLTLLLPRSWAGAALWTKQDFEESLGKDEELGLKIVIDERLKLANHRSPKDPRQNRAFLVVQIKGEADADAAKIRLLRRVGYATAVLTLRAGTPLSRYMQFIHYTVFGVAYLRGVNFVTQPGVELYKDIANRLYAEARKRGGVGNTRLWQAMKRHACQAHWRGMVTLHYDQIDLDVNGAGGNATAIYSQILKQLSASRQIEYGELTFFGDTRYSPDGRRMRKVLEAAAERLFRSILKMPVDVYEGPAMNHSYHEMIIGHGKCLSTILLSEKQEQLPAADYTAEYHMSQFLATKAALEERGRPVVAILVKDLSEKSLAALDEFFRQTAAFLK